MAGPGTEQTGVEHSGFPTQAERLAFELAEERLGQLA